MRNMLFRVFIVFLIFSFSSVYSADIPENPGAGGGTVKVSVGYKPEQIVLKQCDGFTAVSLKGEILPSGIPGEPCIPSACINVALPAGSRAVSVRINTDGEILLARNITVYPSQPAVFIGGPAPAFCSPDPDIYLRDSVFPSEEGVLLKTGSMRGNCFASVRLNPVRYNPVKRELYLVTGFSVSVSYVNNPDAPRFLPARSGMFRAAVKDMVVNPEEMDQVSSGPVPLAVLDYLIITDAALEASFQVLADHRTDHDGLTTSVVTVEDIAVSYTGADLQEKIRKCIDYNVSTNGTAWVVLGGDDTVVPDRDCPATSVTSITDMPTDLYYSDLDGTWDDEGTPDGIYGEPEDNPDMMPDVIVGRIPVQTAAQAGSYINKLISYELSPPAGLSEKVLMMGVWCWDTYTGTSRPLDDCFRDDLPGFYEHSPVSDSEIWQRRLYRDSLQPYMKVDEFALLTDTLTSWDSSVAGDYAADASNIAARLNESWGMVFFDTHGNTDIWGTETGVFDDTDAAALTGMTPLIYTIACLTNHFDGVEPCLSEAFIRNASGGALAYIGCSREGIGYPGTYTGGPSMYFQDYFLEYALRKGSFYGGHIRVGEAFSLHKAEMVEWVPYGVEFRWLQYGINLSGDPYMPLLSVKASADLEVTEVHVTGGDGDTLLDPGETADLYFYVRNWGYTGVDNVLLTLSTADPDVTLHTSSAAVGSIPPQGSSVSIPVVLEVSPSCAADHDIDISVQINATAAGPWNQTVSVTTDGRIYATPVTADVTSLNPTAVPVLTLYNSGTADAAYTVLGQSTEYIVRNSAEGGTAFSWIELSGTGSSETFGDDQTKGPYPIGFSFDFYGTSYSQVWVCSNGWLTFRNPSGNTVNVPVNLPNAGNYGSDIPEDLIAFCWMDLNPENGGEILYHNPDADTFILEFSNIPVFGNDTAVYTVEVILKSDGSIMMQYLDVPDAPYECGIGMQDTSETEGKTIAFREQFLNDSLAVSIRKPEYILPSWVTDISPGSGTAGAAGSADLTLTLSGAALSPGTYQTAVGIQTDREGEVLIEIPVTLTVSNAYTLTPAAGANGTIDPAIPVEVAEGDSQEFTFTPDTGYVVDDVLVGGVSVGNVSSYTFTDVSADNTIHVTFKLTPFTITASVTGGQGTITPSGAVSVDQGADQLFTISPASNYEITDVLINGSSIGPVTEYTFPAVSADGTIEVLFTKIPGSGGGGGGCSAGSGTDIFSSWIILMCGLLCVLGLMKNVISDQ